MEPCLSHFAIAAASDTCSGGKEWQQCATACPLTCDNYDTAAFVCTESCIEGCACPEGKVELDGVCVEPSTCASKLADMATWWYNDLWSIIHGQLFIGCSQCVEGQRCSAVLSADCENLICKDPIAGIYNSLLARARKSEWSYQCQVIIVCSTHCTIIKE